MVKVLTVIGVVEKHYFTSVDIRQILIPVAMMFGVVFRPKGLTDSILWGIGISDLA